MDDRSEVQILRNKLMDRKRIKYVVLDTGNSGTSSRVECCSSLTESRERVFFPSPKCYCPGSTDDYEGEKGRNADDGDLLYYNRWPREELGLR